MIEDLLGGNYESILGGSGIIITILSGLIYKYIKKRSIGDAIGKVVGFFSKDMTDEERTDFGLTVKNLASRKSIKVLNNLVGQLEKLDAGAIKEHIGDVMIIASGILSAMLKNGAFDDNETLKLTLKTIVDKYINV